MIELTSIAVHAQPGVSPEAKIISLTFMNAHTRERQVVNTEYRIGSTPKELIETLIDAAAFIQETVV